MKKRSARRMYAVLSLTAAILVTAAPASAQFKPRPLDDPATGEKYHIEGGAGLWFPNAAIIFAAEGLGIPGSQIDFKNDLGLTDQRFSALQLQLRPARKHKFRFQYVPIKYEQSAINSRDIIFLGQRYTLGLPVNSTLLWKAYRIGYEYDFIAKNRWFVGFILEAKYTDVTATLTLPIRNLNEHARAYGPIPAVGGIARVYVVPNISITADITGFSVPKSIADRFSPGSKAHYVDVDIYGTLNLTNNIGAQLGYRSLDLGFVYEANAGDFDFKGMYFGVVARY
ncbi:MAG: hypothetical protein HY655_05365 [Acidobacteria bacterium]|nr:hypothetical protein [Acidobacteriota bacterium]